jgi:hypothetical protein
MYCVRCRQPFPPNASLGSSDALPGKYQLRLEVEEAGAAKAFWETDWELR